MKLARAGEGELIEDVLPFEEGRANE